MRDFWKRTHKRNHELSQKSDLVNCVCTKDYLYRDMYPFGPRKVLEITINQIGVYNIIRL